MMEATDARQADDPGTGRTPSLRDPSSRGVADRGVDSLGVVVVDVLPEEAS